MEREIVKIEEGDTVFDKNYFLKVLGTQCRDSNRLPGQVWGLAENVFAAMMRPNNGEMEWRVNFYFDDRDVKVRDEDSNVQHMAQEVQLFMSKGFVVAALSADHDDHILFAYFRKDPTGFDPEQVISYASHLFVKTDNDEIEWFDSAKLIPFSIIGK